MFAYIQQNKGVEGQPKDATAAAGPAAASPAPPRWLRGTFKFQGTLECSSSQQGAWVACLTLLCKDTSAELG